MFVCSSFFTRENDNEEAQNDSNLFDPFGGLKSGFNANFSIVVQDIIDLHSPGTVDVFISYRFYDEQIPRQSMVCYRFLFSRSATEESDDAAGREKKRWFFPPSFRLDAMVPVSLYYSYRSSLERLLRFPSIGVKTSPYL